MDCKKRYAHNRNTKNFGTSKPVGHVGSSVLKKAETVFIEKEDNVSIVKCEYLRIYAFQ
jgi:hypothetical protein